MDLVKEFKSKLTKFAKETGWKYKVLYTGYEEALKENKLHAYFHKPCKLAEITTPSGVVELEIAGRLDIDLMSPDGYVMTFNGNIPTLTPFETTTIDDVGVSHEGVYLSDDNDISQLLAADETDWHFFIRESTFVQASFKDSTYAFEDFSIAKAIFDTEAVKSLIDDNSDEKDTKTTDEAKSCGEKSEKDTPQKSRIKDSGNRTKFESGAVRDIQTGKGRCDLLPLDIVEEFFGCEISGGELEEIGLFQKDKNYIHLIAAAKKFTAEYFPNEETAILEYACHLEDGCEKYGDRNWEKGIPLSRFVDSGVRHYLKFKRGDNDERHDRAFLWNALCGAWTCKHHPKLVSQ